jgi:NAD(P)-dependent dehydrogenase (short-subunit alcohol dehydrogenase family)
MKFADRIVMVSGAASGIGKAAARRHRPTPRRERRRSPIAASISTRERSPFETSEGGMIVKADDTELKEGGYSCDSSSS